MLGSYVVFLGERATGLSAHQVDLVVKTLCLMASTIVLFLFSRWYTSESGAYCVIGFYCCSPSPVSSASSIGSTSPTTT
jgi:hypothetical protein